MLDLEQLSTWLDNASALIPGQKELVEHVILNTFGKAIDLRLQKLVPIAIEGPTGCGKTFLGKALASSFPLSNRAKYIDAATLFLDSTIHGPERLVHQLLASSESHLLIMDNAQLLFEQKHDSSPDTADDAKAPQLEFQLEPASIEHHFTCIIRDHLDHGSRLKFVIFLVSQVHQIPTSLRRPCRISRHFKLHWSSQRQRKAILETLFSNFDIDNKNDVIQILAGQPTSGFTPADILGLLQQARIECQEASLKLDDFLLARHSVQPSLLVGRVCSRPPFQTKIVGLEQQKEQLKEAITAPFLNPQRARLPKGILLEGPSGCGKTLLAQMLSTIPICTQANEKIRGSPITFLSIDSQQILSKYYGQSSRNLARIFDEARQAAPCILFFDQIDALVGKRASLADDEHAGRLITTFLVEMDGILAKQLTESDGEYGQVIVVGATTRKNAIDAAILRPGRLEMHIHVPLPNQDARKSFFVHVQSECDKFSLSDSEIDNLVHRTDSFSTAELDSLCREAALLALRQDINAENVNLAHFLELFK